MQNKLQQQLYHTLVLVEIGAQNRERIGTIVTGVGHIFELQKEALNGVTLAEVTQDNFIEVQSQSQSETTDIFAMWEKWLLGQTQKWQDILFILEPSEIASLWHLPHEEFHASRIKWLEGKHVALPSEMQEQTEGVYLGDNVVRGKDQKVYVPDSDRAAHKLVIGKTGTGKSTFLHNLIQQDIEAGSGIAVIDPSPRVKNRNIIPRILRQSIPAEREQDVFLWDLSDPDYPPPLNILRVPPYVNKQVAAATIMNVFERIYEAEWGRTRMSHTLAMCMHAVMQDETPTLRDISRLYRDEAYRKQLTDNLQSEAAIEFWDRFEDMRPAEQRELFEPLLHRLERIYDHPLLYPVMCHPEGLDFRELIQNKRIVLISLTPPEGVTISPQEEALLGSILVTQIQLAIQANQSPEPFYLYIDEAEHFVTTSLPQLFSEARGLNLHLILANQFFKQLTGNTYNAVMGNVGAMIAFRVGDEDGRVLDDYMKPQFSAYDLSHQEDYHAAVFMRYKGKQQPAFCLHTQNMELPNDPEQLAAATKREARIRQVSRERYTPLSKDEVLKWLKERYPRRRSKGSGSSPDEDTQPKKDIEDDFSDPETV